jgi:hypothetical protein
MQRPDNALLPVWVCIVYPATTVALAQVAIPRTLAPKAHIGSDLKIVNDARSQLSTGPSQSRREWLDRQ